MAIPTIISQLIALVYNVADTWFIGQTDNPYMVAASALVLTVFLMTTGIANLFGVGGGSLVVRLLGRNDEDEAKRWSLPEPGDGGRRFSCLFYPVLPFHEPPAAAPGRQR